MARIGLSRSGNLPDAPLVSGGEKRCQKEEKRGGKGVRKLSLGAPKLRELAGQDVPVCWRYWGSRLTFESARRDADHLEMMGFETLIKMVQSRHYIYYR
jgi:hypothetical protein